MLGEENAAIGVLAAGIGEIAVCDSPFSNNACNLALTVLPIIVQTINSYIKVYSKAVKI